MKSLIDVFYGNNSTFELFSPLHLGMLFLISFIVLSFVYYQDEWDKYKFKKMTAILIILFLTQQSLLYSWYFFTGTFDVVDALPLYPCRLLQILSLISLFNHNEKIYNILVILNIPSALVALILADTNNLGFPNAMFIQFFMGHGLMLIVPLYLKYKYHYSLKDKYISTVVKIQAVYFVSISLVNFTLNSNYGYVSHVPDSLGDIAFIPQYIYTPGFFMLYASASILFYKLFTNSKLEPVKVVLRRKV